MQQLRAAFKNKHPHLYFTGTGRPCALSYKRTVADTAGPRHLGLGHPLLLAGVPLLDALREPQSDLGLCGLDGIGAVAHVAADLDTQVTTDGAGGGVSGVGGAEQGAAHGDHVGALPDHAHDGAGHHVVDQGAEETLGRQVGVMLLNMLASRGVELEGNQLEALRRLLCGEVH